MDPPGAPVRKAPRAVPDCPTAPLLDSSITDFGGPDHDMSGGAAGRDRGLGDQVYRADILTRDGPEERPDTLTSPFHRLPRRRRGRPGPVRPGTNAALTPRRRASPLP